MIYKMMKYKIFFNLMINFLMMIIKCYLILKIKYTKKKEIYKNYLRQMIIYILYCKQMKYNRIFIKVIIMNNYVIYKY